MHETAVRRAWMAVGIVAVVASTAPAGATILCQKKSGVVTLRSATCAKKETALDLAQLGVTGPQGPKGDQGVSGGLRAFAHVAANGTTLLAARNITAVTHPESGIYCLTPDASIDPTAGPGLVTPDAGHSTGSDLAAWAQIPPNICSNTDYEVQTVDLNGAPSDAVGFVFAVP